MRYLDPKYDLTFKRVFGEHKHLCISLINSMLPLEETQEVVSIEYQSNELTPEVELLRHSIVDVRCTDNFGRQFLVEMQMYWTESFMSRVLFNASKAYVRQLSKKEDFQTLRPVYALSFLNENFEKSPEMAGEYYHHYKITNVEHTEKHLKGLEFIFIELKKFKPHNRAARKLHDLWLRFLTEINESTESAPAELLENNETCEAVKYMEVGAYTIEQLSAYEDWIVDTITAQSALTEFEAKGLAKGLAEGMTKGLAEGITKGITEGMTKGLAKGEEERKKLQQEVEDRNKEIVGKDKEIADREKEIAELKRLLGKG
jgi:predicted transposase/invertase (TIGR01784 family)